MSSLYLRGSTWWAKSYEQGKMVRWSLRDQEQSGSEAQAEGARLTAPDKSPCRSRLKSPATWGTAAQGQLAYYLAYGTRRVHEAERQVRTLSRTSPDRCSRI